MANMDLAPFMEIILQFILLFFLLFVAIYIYQAMALMTVAKRLGEKTPRVYKSAVANPKGG